MKKHISFLTALLLICINISACCANPKGSLNETKSSNDLVPSKCTDALPVFSSFSGCAIDNGYLTFPIPQRATLVNKGKIEEIATTDSRLIRLLNFILYSENQQLSAMTLGLLSEEDIHSYYDTHSVWLSISFDDKDDNSFVPNLSEMVIFPSAYLLFGSQEGISQYVEEHFPYEVLLNTWAEQNDVNAPDVLNKFDEPWMNMLQIAGFID